VTIAWVLGSAGLLGAALCRALHDDGTELFFPDHRFAWGDPEKLPDQMAAAVRTFARRAAGSRAWEIHWAAGIGTMGSSAADLAPETRALTLFLALVQAEPLLMARSGTLSFASSAGAIYAGSSDEIITEHSAPAPTTAYAVEKLVQEDLVRRFVTGNPSTAALIARISTIYGPGQASGKKQGLLGYMARNIIRNQVINIFVPYDTVRDYIDADDAAVFMIGAVRAYSERSKVLVKIIASEYPATIAEIVSIFRRLSRRTPLVVRSANRLSALYTRRVRFRSVESVNDSRPPAKRLPLGISQLMRAEHLAFIKAPPERVALPPPK
jgi:UDP-glucose 4-epimerase